MGHAEHVVDRFVRAIADADAARRDELAAAFVEVALEFAERYGISYDVWIEVGVPRTVLCRAGISAGSDAARHCVRRRGSAGV